MRRVLSATAIVVLLATTAAVSAPAADSSGVLVRIFRDEASPARQEFDRRLAEVNRNQLRTPSGKPIYITANTSTRRRWRSRYQYLLDTKIGSAFKPELIVLNSADDVKNNESLHADALRATNVCGAAFKCYVFVPSWTQGEDARAALLVIKALAEVP